MAPSDAALEERIDQGLMGTGEDATSVVRAKTAAWLLQARWTRRAVWLTAVSVVVLALTLAYSLWEGTDEPDFPRYRFELENDYVWRFDTTTGEAVLFGVHDGEYVYMTVSPPSEPRLIGGSMPSLQPPPFEPSD